MLLKEEQTTVLREIEIKTTIVFSLLKFTRQPGGQSDMV